MVTHSSLAHRSAPNSSKKAPSVALVRLGAAHTTRLRSWSTTVVR